ncbi:glycoside hydrolase family 97 protein [Pedobacter namyangjuensis]|uniref:glycoside hydrolase family 97 protein n=1 Tax=Pedobacter namyangjuensis TaxID=600626 RepID=UPI000DE46E25|nr:glycoside hydrolase family 97 protein [Pedobacter namyangjuensis]
MKLKFSGLLIAMLIGLTTWAKDYQLHSPDRQILLTVNINTKITWQLKFRNQPLLLPSEISLRVSGPVQPGIDPLLLSRELTSHNELLTAVVPIKERSIMDSYNELKLNFKGGYTVLFRAYNDGVAYRFQTGFTQPIVEVIGETADFNFAGNHRVFWPEETNKDFLSHFESLYKDSVLSAFGTGQHAALPMLVSTGPAQLLISEADLYDYPNLFLFGTSANRLTAGFPKVIAKSSPVRDRGIRIEELAGYIASTTGKRSYPWRSIAIAPKDKDLLVNNLTYKLSTPCLIAQTDWIKPGKVAWDWWNDNNIYGVDFASGINTQTYKYYIDFAAAYGLEYIMLDEGWTRTTTDLLHTAKDIDIEAIIAYGKTRNVGVWLWTLWEPLDKDMENILSQYAKWGAKGIKVDFMARAEQYMVNFYERTASTAAKYKLMVDLHGAYKPVGLNRKYPNVLTYEGVRGLENHKWSAEITPRHNLSLPFIRMAAGPMDYTPGAMKNANKKNFSIVYSEPMSMGTRAHQVAMFVMYESPLQMLADNPSNYLKDSTCTRFISRIPTVWEKTVALEGKVGEYAIVARKNGKNWYISGMTDWKEREFRTALDFLDSQRYKMDVLSDGANAKRHAADYKVTSSTVTRNDQIDIKMDQGGGWTAILTPVE